MQWFLLFFAVGRKDKKGVFVVIWSQLKEKHCVLNMTNMGVRACLETPTDCLAGVPIQLSMKYEFRCTLRKYC